MKYAKFSTLEDFTTWHEAIKLQLGIGSSSTKNYTTAIEHPQTDEVICLIDKRVSEDSLTILSKNDAVLQGFIAGDTQVALEEVIRNSIAFASELTIKFASENVGMGITQAGKTKEVADYLADVTRYAQTGSLYEIINEIDRLIAEPPPQDLAPFVTIDRLTAFKQKILDYLS